MEKYLIFTDVSCDIDRAVVEKYGVKFVPMEYSLRDEMRICTGYDDQAVLKELYDAQRKGDFTRTTQINPYNYIDAFSPYMEDGYSIMYLSLSGGLSQTYNSACTAKGDLKIKFPQSDLYVVDTLSATGGLGVLCERACRNRQIGMTIKENFADIVGATQNIRHWFFVQDLDYLKRGGRVSAAAAVFGKMLHIKPILKIDPNGKLAVVTKKKGNKSAVEELVDIFRKSYDYTSGDVVYVTNADDNELGNTVAEMIRRRYPSAVIRQKTVNPIIGAHVGPGTIMLCYMGVNHM